jgi:hypothetical protein
VTVTPGAVHDDATKLPRRVDASAELAQRKLVRMLVDGEPVTDETDARVTKVAADPVWVEHARKQARLWPEGVPVNPREIALRYAVGEIDRDQMLTELIAWPYTHGHLPGRPE